MWCSKMIFRCAGRIVVVCGVVSGVQFSCNSLGSRLVGMSENRSETLRAIWMLFVRQTIIYAAQLRRERKFAKNLIKFSEAENANMFGGKEYVFIVIFA